MNYTCSIIQTFSYTRYFIYGEVSLVCTLTFQYDSITIFYMYIKMEGQRQFVFHRDHNEHAYYIRIIIKMRFTYCLQPKPILLVCSPCHVRCQTQKTSWLKILRRTHRLSSLKNWTLAVIRKSHQENMSVQIMYISWARFRNVIKCTWRQIYDILTVFVTSR